MAGKQSLTLFFVSKVKLPINKKFNTLHEKILSFKFSLIEIFQIIKKRNLIKITYNVILVSKTLVAIFTFTNTRKIQMLNTNRLLGKVLEQKLIRKLVIISKMVGTVNDKNSMAFSLAWHILPIFIFSISLVKLNSYFSFLFFPD